ncbi:hypothetical protein H0H92_013369 [Tricholoma furcatifolium]|nr:hypothetical protein H0H92_013369 [Tricholoma furcatifolium]
MVSILAIGYSPRSHPIPVRTPLSTSQSKATKHTTNPSTTGGAQFNSPDNSAPGSQRVNIDHQQVINTAQQHGSGASDLFHTALSYVNNNQHEHEQPVDEASVTQAHQAAYQQGGASNMSANALGSAAAMQVLKQFTSGGSGGGSQNQLISMAMAEATKLFDSAGGGSSGNKQEAVNSAAMTVMKLMVQSKLSGFMGGGNSGGLSGLLSMASKFA